MKQEQEQAPVTTESGTTGEQSHAHEQTEAKPREKLFTQEQVNAIVADRLKRVQKQEPPQPKESSQGQEPGPSAESDEMRAMRKQLDDVLNMMKSQAEQAAEKESENALLQAINGVELAPGDLETVRTLYKANGDLEAAKVMANRLADTSRPASAAKGFNEPGNGVNRNIGELPPNVNDLTKDDVARLKAEGRLREIVEKAHSVGAGAVFRPKSYNR